jgi:ParB family transcriptional regulator, chromosome partitioning protein
MSRKDTLRELLNPVTTTPVQTPGTVHPPKELTRSERTESGAVKAMGLTLQKLSAEAESARGLRAQITSGANVVELEPELIEPSLVMDRISQTDDEAFRNLVKSVEAHGQQVPILVRTHPEKSGLYQIAYGHRRLRAAIVLGRKVRAVVREMTNTEVVIAQGKENSERRDLSFIERALFARNLEEAGFDRATLIAALSVHETEVVRLLAVARAIPADVVYAIGPAPKAGRPRWMALTQLLEGSESRLIVDQALADPGFSAIHTDARFTRLYTALSSRMTAKPDHSTWHDPRGRPVVRIERAKAKTRFIVDEKLAPHFGSFVTEKLDELYAAFSARPAEHEPG